MSSFTAMETVISKEKVPSSALDNLNCQNSKTPLLVNKTSIKKSTIFFDHGLNAKTIEIGDRRLVFAVKLAEVANTFFLNTHSQKKICPRPSALT